MAPAPSKHMYFTSLLKIIVTRSRNTLDRGKLVGEKNQNEPLNFVKHFVKFETLFAYELGLMLGQYGLNLCTC